jgi:NADPH2:quinone reductase
MIAVAIAKPGGPDVLKPERRPLPPLGEGEILIKVAAAGVNRPDLMQRAGAYPPPPGASDLPGLEVAGTIAALGAGATRWRIGDRVCALTPGGGYAEFSRTHETHALPVPGDLTMVEAAAIPETFFTVWTNVFDRGALEAGETLLVHGGSSGIGTTAILLAKSFGAHVIVTAGSDEKCAACIGLGADAAINYRTFDFVAETKRITGGRGADVTLDMVGGPYVTRDLEAAAEKGRIVQIAFPLGARAEISLATLMMKRLVLTGSTLRPRTIAEKGAIAAALREKVWPMLEKGECKPVIDATFPLAEAARAHERLESGAHVGKIVLRVGV